MKAEKFGNVKLKLSTVYRSNQPGLFKRISKERYEGKSKSKEMREPVRKREGSEKWVGGRCRGKQPKEGNEHNISINVCINNAKIETTNKKKKNSITKLENQLFKATTTDTNSCQNNVVISNKRFRT
jgi:hypothetical protein